MCFAVEVISHCKIFIDFEVVVCEAWNFIKGLLKRKLSTTFPLLKSQMDVQWSSVYGWIAGYSGGQAAVIGSVLETNLKTGKRKGVWRRAEVLVLSLLKLIL